MLLRFVHFEKKNKKTTVFWFYSRFFFVLEVLFLDERAVSSSIIHTVLLFLHWRWNSKLSKADWSTNSSVMFVFLNKVEQIAGFLVLFLFSYLTFVFQLQLKFHLMVSIIKTVWGKFSLKPSKYSVYCSNAKKIRLLRLSQPSHQLCLHSEGLRRSEKWLR